MAVPEHRISVIFKETLMFVEGATHVFVSLLCRSLCSRTLQAVPCNRFYQVRRNLKYEHNSLPKIDFFTVSAGYGWFAPI